MVCVFPFVLPPLSPRGCGGWEPSANLPLGAVGLEPPCGAGSQWGGTVLPSPCLLCPHLQLHSRLSHRAER